MNPMPRPVPPPPTLPASAPARWDSRELLGVHREALIEHRGEHYRLRLTAAGKLILTK